MKPLDRMSRKPERETPPHGWGARIRRWPRRDKVLLAATGMVAAATLLGFLSYMALGHFAIETLYQTETGIGLVDRAMANRASTPLASYYERADALVLAALVLGAQALFFLAAVLVFSRNPIGVLMTAVSFGVLWFMMFTVIELFPGLIGTLQLSNVSYYGIKDQYLPDETLGIRERPHRDVEIRSLMGAAPVYGVDLGMRTTYWMTNSEGFRDAREPESVDVAAIGDSFLEHGSRESDLFPRVLETHLNGSTVANLGKAGYGPFQYLEVLRRYALDKEPDTALFVFYSGNDIRDIERYRAWQSGEEFPGFSYKVYHDLLTSASFLERFFVATTDAFSSARGAISTMTELVMKPILRQGDYEPGIHRDLALVELGPERYPMRFIDLNGPESAEALLDTPQWQALGEILAEFRAESAARGIRPIVVYIPTAADIYARYSTADSGANWLGLRERQIASQGNAREAMARLTAELDLGLVDLTPPFEAAAESGELLFEQLDSHWNDRGIEVAAAIVAEAIRNEREGAALPETIRN